MEQEFDQRLPYEVESRENSMRDPEQNDHGGTLEAVASTSSSHHRREKSGYDELPKEMKEMKIKDDRTDDHDDNAKVGFQSIYLYNDSSFISFLQH